MSGALPNTLVLWVLMGGLASQADAATPGLTSGTPDAISTDLRAVAPPDDTSASKSTAVSDTFAIVSEPGVLVLLGLGLTGVAAARRRKKH
ncbi:MAG: PEP-CTERM sorting domain-containing protein [Vicinamibacterales bacterium]